MTIKKLTYLFIVFFIIIYVKSFSQGQCLGGGCSGGYQYPSGTFSSNTNSWTTVSTNNWAGEYAIYDVTSGSTYEWSLCSTDGGSVTYDAQLTLINNTTLASICFSSDYCETNKPKIQWTATFTGTVRVLITAFSGSGCLTNSISTSLVWRCSSCGSGSAPVNDNCSGATTLTVDAVATNGTVSGATNSNITGCAGTAEDDVWYKFTTSTAGYYSITVVGSASFDPVIDLRSGACDGTNVSCADYSNSGQTEILTASLAATTTYYIRVYDYFSTIPSTLTFTIQVTKPANCTPYYTSGTSAGDYINNVTLSTINNTSGAGPSYYNDYFNTISTTLQAGTSQSLSATVGTYGGQTVAAWIDYNQDGDFSDAGESLGEYTNIDIGLTATFSFTIPVTASSGNCRMRIRTVWSDVGIDPCATYGWGEAEDYKIIITPACTTPGTPLSLSTSGIGVSSATLNWAAGSPAGSATVTYYWAVNTTSTVDYETNYIQRGTTTSLTSGALSGFLNGTTYYWTVKAITSCDATVSSYAAAINFTTLCTTPSVPTALNTTGTTTTSSTFNWTASASGSPTISYYWAVGPASNVTYEANYTDRGITSVNSATTFILLAGTTYYWTVKAVTSCNSTASSYPAAISLTTNNVPTPIVTWLGGTSGDWQTATNWSSNPSLPAVTDNVIIPSGCTFYPNITTGGLSIGNSTTTRKCKTLTINSGGTVTVNSAFYIYITDVVDIEGTFNHQSSNATPDMGFLINSGGKVTVKNGGILNIGSSSISGGVPAGTINEMNDIKITDGNLEIQAGSKVFIMDDLQITGTAGVKGKLIMTGGDLYIKYYGDGATNSLGFDTWANSNTNISGGNIYICGQDNGASAQMLDWNTSAVYSITGGTFHLLNEQSSGVNNYTGYIDFGGKAINNLTINRTGIASTNISNNLTINGDLTLSAGSFSGGTTTLTIAGSIMNNAGSTAAFDNTTASTVICTGINKQIGGTSSIKFYNLTFNSGSSYTINSPTYTWVSNNFTLNTNSTVTIASGKYLDLYGTSVFNGSITAVGAYNNTIPGTSNGRDIDLNSGAGLSGTGSVNADLRIFDNNTSLTSDFNLLGHFIINTSATFTMTTHTFTLNGDWTNNGTFTAGSGEVIFTGTSKNITGSLKTTFNNLTFNSGSSITINPTGVSPDERIEVTGIFNMQQTSSVDLLNGKKLSLFSTTNLFNGNLTTQSTKYNNGTTPSDYEIYIRRNNTLSGSGTIGADILFYRDLANTSVTTVGSNLTIDGSIGINSDNSGATLSAGAFEISIAGSWTNAATFTAGTSTIKFNGSVSSTVDAFGYYNGSSKVTADFYNVVIERGSDTLSIFNKPMRVANNFTINNGIFSTGWKTNSNGNGGQNRRLTVEKIAYIAPAGKLYIGYWRACNNPNENLSSICAGCTTCNGDSLNVPVFKGDLINFGSILTNRPLISGYQDIKLAGARITGLGNANEFGVDFQIEDGLSATQVGSADIQGDFIVPATTSFSNTGQDNLTIRGNLYIYSNFSHNGTVNVYGSVTNSSAVTDNPSVANATFNLYHYTINNLPNTIKFSNPVTFGNLNIKSNVENGQRRIQQNITVNGDFSIENNREVWANNCNISILGNWLNSGNFIKPNYASGGKANYSANNGDYISSTSVYQIFTATTPFTLISVTVYAETAGNRTFFLRNSSGADLVTPLVVNLPVGKSIAVLNFSVPVGVDMRLGVSDFTGGNLYRDAPASALSYPYTLGSVGSITGAFNGTSVVTDRWYWCYDWEFIEPIATQTVSFTGNGSQTMGGSTSTTFYNLTVNKAASSNLSFGNNGLVTNQLNLTNGYIVTTASKLLSIDDEASVSPSGGSSTSYVKGPVKKIGRDGVAGPYSFIFPLGKNSTFARLYLVHYSGTTATTDAFTAEYNDFQHSSTSVTGALHHVSTVEYWELAKNSGNVNLNKRIRLYSENNASSGIVAFNNSDLTVAHFNGTAWEDIGYATNTNNSGAATPAGWISSEFTSSFSPFTFGSKTSANPLPVTLLEFNAIANVKQVDLNWTTASEYNNDFFLVEKSKDLKNTEQVGKVPGAGNSNSEINYFMVDKNPYPGVSYYRLKQTDFDGKYKYSDWVAVEFRTPGITDSKNNIIEPEITLSVVNVYPNPTKGELFVTVNSSISQAAHLSVIDLMGKQHIARQAYLPEGFSRFGLELENVSPGTYILIISGKNEVLQKKIIKQ